MAAARFKLVFFCPLKATGEVLNTLFRAYPMHVGRIGEYEQCAFMTPGIGLQPVQPYHLDLSMFTLDLLSGQFRAVGSANPTIGVTGQLEKVEEHRVEVLVRDDGRNEQIRGVVSELKKAHPYEEVAYEVYRIEDF